MIAWVCFFLSFHPPALGEGLRDMSGYQTL